MGRIGLVAGGGKLPLEFIRAVKRKGGTVVVFAIQGQASPELEREADRIYWMNVGQYRKFAFLLIRNGIRELALLGKIEKNVLYSGIYDREARIALEKLKDKKDYSILGEITRHLNKICVKVMDPAEYLSHLFPASGVLTECRADERMERDIEFGYKTAKKMAEMDIGQTIIIKDGAVVAVEAMEGTDAAVSRAGAIAGKGCVMVKVSRPDQDMRWDVPVVGPETVQKLCENGFSALAIESGKMFVVDKEKMKSLADSAGLVIKVI